MCGPQSSIQVSTLVDEKALRGGGGSSVLKVEVQRVRPGTEAYDSEWALLKSWLDEYHAGEGRVHVHGLIVGTYSLAGPCLYRKYQEAGLNINCFLARPVRFQALFAAPPKSRCHDHGWKVVAEYRLRQGTSESRRTCSRLLP